MDINEIGDLFVKYNFRAGREHLSEKFCWKRIKTKNMSDNTYV